MFKTTGLFAETPCPEGERCALPFCIFSHVPKIEPTPQTNTPAVATKQGGNDVDNERALKKRRIGQVGSSTVSRTHSLSNNGPSPVSKPLTASVARTSTPVSAKRSISPPARKTSLKPHSSLPSKPPPAADPVPKTAGITLSKPQLSTKAPVIEQLVPRKLANPPAQFPVRVQLVKLIYAEYIRLTKLVSDSTDADKDALMLSKPETITLVLDEEEKVAKESPTVYSNVIKLRIKRLRDMKTLAPWKEERKKQVAKANPELVAAEKPVDKRVNTSLTPAQELALLPQLLTPITDLREHGYVPNPPKDEDIEAARRGVEMSNHWEVCDRCQTRFQVFPSRRESDGALTTNGACSYHWGRRRRAPKSTTTAEQQQDEDRWTCCGAVGSTAPCTTAESHVFKVSDASRLASAMQFEGTTTPGPSVPEKAVAFDCEMGYTSYGLELIRLTATSWPDGEELVDALVRPLGEVIDLNSRFSGVWPEDWLNAVPYDEEEETRQAKQGATDSVDGPPKTKRKREDGSAEAGISEAKEPLKMVSSPQRARELLLDHLTTTTPLIGHAIDNDLNSVRICHPAIVDTVLLYPAQRPLPIRLGLKMLTKKYLDVDIQMGGDRGHDSKEDARATGELVRFKIKQLWQSLKLNGWRVSGDRVVSPEEQ